MQKWGCTLGARKAKSFTGNFYGTLLVNTNTSLLERKAYLLYVVFVKTKSENTYCCHHLIDCHFCYKLPSSLLASTLACAVWSPHCSPTSYSPAWLPLAVSREATSLMWPGSCWPFQFGFCLTSSGTHGLIVHGLPESLRSPRNFLWFFLATFGPWCAKVLPPGIQPTMDENIKNKITSILNMYSFFPCYYYLNNIITIYIALTLY